MSDDAVDPRQSPDGDGGGAEECGGAGAVDGTHLEELPDGAGCAEIWEYLADRRDAGEGTG